MALITCLRRIQFDLKPEMVEAIADGALGGRCHLSTPTRAQYIELIEQSWG